MMVELKIEKLTGLKAEDCAVIAQRAGHFKSDIHLTKDNKSINAKSIMGIISLAMKSGDTVYLDAVGFDEENAIATLSEMIQKL